MKSAVMIGAVAAFGAFAASPSYSAAILANKFTPIANASVATTYTWTYTSLGSPASASGTFTIDPSGNSAGSFNLIGITGAVDGDVITGLIANPTQPSPSTSADGLFIYDNVLIPDTTPYLTASGVLFSSAGGFEYNLFSDSANVYELYRATPGVGYAGNSVGTLTISAVDSVVPEPASWVLMIAGFGLVGLANKRRRYAFSA